MTKTTNVNAIIRKLYVEANGQLIEVKQVEDVSEYPKTTTVYSKTLVKGAKAGQTTYAVAVEDFIPKKRTSAKESIQSLMAQGLSAEEILARLTA